MSYLETNMKLLVKKFPELALTVKENITNFDIEYELLTARSGQLTLKANFNGRSIYLHSAYDPHKEAQRVVEDKSFDNSDIIFIFGLGLCYQLQEIVRKTANKKVHIVVIEKDPRVLKLALENIDLRSILDYSFINFYINLPGRAIFMNLINNLNVASAKNIYFFDRQPWFQLYEDYYTEILRKVRDVISLKTTNIATMVEFKGDWLRNSLKNLPVTYNSPGINILKNKFPEYPAIIVSAGPSLDKNVTHLGKAKGKAVIIAVGTALKTLFRENIVPDLVITYDASELNYSHFEEIDYGVIPLAFDPMVYPQIVDEHQGIKFVFSTKQTQLNSYLEEVDSKGYLESGGSIATAAFSLALKMGCNPVILTGQDLAFSEGRTHTSASIFGQDKVADEVSLHVFKVPGYYGEPVLTQRTFDAFRQWFEMRIEQLTDREIINATEGGAKIKGTEQLSLAAAIDKYCGSSIDVVRVLTEAARQYQSDDGSILKKKLLGIVDDLRRFANDAKRAGELCGELERMYKQKATAWKKVRKTMRRIDDLDEAIKGNQASGLLTEMIQEILLASERGQLVKENENDDDFVRAEKRSAGLKILYTRMYKDSNEVLTWFQETINTLNNNADICEGVS